ncbi:hypothetical protein BOTBODRAFT_403640 [Botryobasidium botryosum FD-172 SS1]|uniref:Uncharacterized protein n=1 Tax=Botryobasidium botryosum (strain FD-172 SS1) TaxID=930990 RepID=A0A067MBE0_BOTB1|nr:hypothetical protein BOTBODRAFT_403640 [Botryobasidium botryosum FD-172 SS1]
MSPLEMYDLLGGYLPDNLWETGWIVLTLCPRNSAKFDLAKMMGETMDFVAGSGGVCGVRDKQKWHCLNCVKGLFRTRFKERWSLKKLSDGAPDLEKCWYAYYAPNTHFGRQIPTHWAHRDGYNCLRQSYSLPHAERFNHLCAPPKSQGDASSRTT